MSYYRYEFELMDRRWKGRIWARSISDAKDTVARIARKTTGLARFPRSNMEVSFNGYGDAFGIQPNEGPTEVAPAPPVPAGTPPAAAECAYYLRGAGDGLVELRQVRFRDQLDRGAGHPQDVCALARSVEEMRGMVERLGLGPVDWSSPEAPEADRAPTPR